MSFMLTRPPRPLPGTSAKSTLYSRAMRRTSGDERTFPDGRATAGAGGAGRGAVGGAAVAAGFAGWTASAGAGFSTPSPSITATTVFTPTVSFSLTRILARIPEAGEGISASTLSVEISKSGSSRSTRSPTLLIHLVTVPSATLSPICGMMTLVGIGGPLSSRKSKVESQKNRQRCLRDLSSSFGLDLDSKGMEHSRDYSNCIQQFLRFILRNVPKVAAQH